MILSMTGYGKSEKKNKNFLFVVELKSLNSRYFDIISKIDDSLFLFENEIISLIKEKCIRGKFFLRIKMVPNHKFQKQSLILNQGKLKEYMSLVDQVQNQLKIKDDVSLNHVLGIQDLFYSDSTVDNTINKKTLFTGVKAAIKDLINYRKQEGSNLRLDLLKKMKNIDKQVSVIKKYTKKSINVEYKKYNSKINAVLKDLNNIAIDKDRIYQEISILLERRDINEELVRLESHIKLYYTCLNSRENSGKKINFLLQEINREINTIGSKSDNIKISHKVVSIKDSLEQIKEQVQNIL